MAQNGTLQRYADYTAATTLTIGTDYNCAITVKIVPKYRPIEGYKRTSWFEQNPTYNAEADVGAWFEGSSFVNPKNGSVNRSLLHIKKELKVSNGMGAALLYPDIHGGTITSLNPIDNRRYNYSVILGEGDAFKWSGTGMHNGRECYMGVEATCTSRGAFTYRNYTYNVYEVARYITACYWNSSKKQWVKSQRANINLIGIEQSVTNEYDITPPTKPYILRFNTGTSTTATGLSYNDSWTGEEWWSPERLISSAKEHIGTAGSPTSTYSAINWGLVTPEAQYTCLGYVAEMERTVDQFRFSVAKRGQRSWNDMMFEACQDIGMWDGNGLGFVRDAISMTQLARSCTQLVVDLTDSISRIGQRELASYTRSAEKFGKIIAEDPKKAKAWAIKNKLLTLKDITNQSANAYLSEHYAWRLTAMDLAMLKEITEYLGPFSEPHDVSQATSSSSYSVDSDGQHYDVNQHFSCYYAPKAEDMSYLRQIIYILDMDLDITNLWDLIPYSFVVDWFTNLGSWFTAVDNYYTMTSRYRAVGTIESLKATLGGKASVVLPDGWLRNIDVTATGYARQCVPYFVFPFPDKVTTPFNPRHFVEAGALLVQRFLV